MSRFEFHIQPTLWYGTYSLRKLSSMRFKKACIVTDASMVSLGVINPVTTMLKELGISYRIFDQVEPDPSIHTVSVGLQHILVTKPDLLIAVGGGSVIDAAKAIMYFCLRVKEEVIKPEVIRKPYFIAVPTTSGTGSEVTSYSVLTDEKTAAKYPLKDQRMLPDLAILDPMFTETLPSKVIAYAGMDVMTHAIEAYVSKERHPLADLFVKEALLLSGESLLPMYKDVSQVSHRMNMLLASAYAGIAFENSGLGLTHGLAHALGAAFKLPHGFVNGLLLPQVLTYNEEDPIHGQWIKERYKKLIPYFEESVIEKAGKDPSLRDVIHVYLDALDFPKSLKEYGLEEAVFLEVLPSMIRKAMEDFCTKSNPRKSQPEELLRLYLHVYYGERSARRSAEG